MKYKWITNVSGDEAFERLVKQCSDNLDKDYILGLPLSKYETLLWEDILCGRLSSEVEYKNGILYDVHEEHEQSLSLVYETNSIGSYIPIPRIVRRLYPSITQEELIENNYRGIYECIKYDI